MGKRKREKKPVLTSPWKIGMMVALMLSATSFGVGYYMVRVYEIDLYWLSSDISRWGVDSYQFFREIYPAAAGVVLLALFTYFVIVSAVRRYKYYLDSGQDYRKMISLAHTIDDLTNPAQIARLSEYPELQNVLRNYGDQISEISEGLENRESVMKSVDLEVEIDSILAGNDMNETLVEGNWWTPIVRKVKVWVDENAGGTAEIRKQSVEARQAVDRAFIACGKIIETASGAGEDVKEIVRSAGELNALAGKLGSGGSGKAADAGSPSDAIAAIETAAATLEERGSVIRDLSEESNGLALNIALMAARGEATEKDLASLAEKVRSAAERFGKLGREFEELARTVSESGRNARSFSGGPVSGGSCASDEAGGVMAVSATIESRSRSLQQKMTILGGDVEEISRSLKLEHGDSGDIEISDCGDERIHATDSSIVNFGNNAEETSDDPGMIDDSGLVIDHGKQWKDSDTAPESGVELEADTGVPSDDVTEEAVTSDGGEPLISGFQDAMSSMQSDANQQQAEKVHDVVDELFIGDPGSGENWDAMQAHSDDRKTDETEPAVESAPGGELPAVEPEVVTDPEPSAPASSTDDSMQDADEEAIHDLFELGAVEYAENTGMNQ